MLKMNKYYLFGMFLVIMGAILSLYGALEFNSTISVVGGIIFAVVGLVLMIFSTLKLKWL